MLIDSGGHSKENNRGWERSRVFRRKNTLSLKNISLKRHPMRQKREINPQNDQKMILFGQFSAGLTVKTGPILEIWSRTISLLVHMQPWRRGGGGVGWGGLGRGTRRRRHLPRTPAGRASFWKRHIKQLRFVWLHNKRPGSGTRGSRQATRRF